MATKKTLKPKRLSRFKGKGKKKGLTKKLVFPTR